MHVEHDEERGRFVARTDGGERMGELVYAVRDGDIWANHTYVDEAYRGHGVAGALVEALAGHARAAGRRIVPICPYVAAAFEREPGKYGDVAKG